MAVEVKRRRFTVEQYHRMGEVGILNADDRVELLDGEIVEWRRWLVDTLLEQIELY